MKKLINLMAVLSLVLTVALSVAAQGTTLNSIDGEKINVQGQNGKVVVLAVGASWLKLSKDQVAITNKLAKKYAGRDVVFYFVATDSTSTKSKNFASDDNLREFAAQNGLGVTILRDSDGALTTKAFQIDQVPSFVILDRTGRVIGEPIGGIDPQNDISVTIIRVIDGIL